jgi:hypothetical protein
MPIDSFAVRQGLEDRVKNIPVVGTAIKNPLFMSLVIVMIIVLTSLLIFGNNSGDSVFKLSLRLGTYCLFPIIAIVFLHNQFLLTETKNTGKSATLEQLFSDVDKVGGGDAAIEAPVPVVSDIKVPIW